MECLYSKVAGCKRGALSALKKPSTFSSPEKIKNLYQNTDKLMVIQIIFYLQKIFILFIYTTADDRQRELRIPLMGSSTSKKT